MVKAPTAPLVVSKAEPVRVGLVTETELTPLPVKVILWLLGPNVIWAACAPDPQRATMPIAISSFVTMIGLQKSLHDLQAAISVPGRFWSAFSMACDFLCDIELQGVKTTDARTVKIVNR